MARLTRARAWLRLGLFVAVVGAGLALRFLTPLGSYLTREGVGETVAALRGSAWAPAIYIGVYIVATSLAVPGSVLTLVGGAAFGVVWGSVFTTIGANAGANVAFLIARATGRAGIVRLAGDRVRGLDRAARTHGFRSLLVLRLVPLVPFTALNFGSGLTAMSWRSYALATAVGILPGTVVYTFFADALLRGSQDASREALLRLLVAGALLLLLSLIPLIVKQVRRHA